MKPKKIEQDLASKAQVTQGSGAQVKARFTTKLQTIVGAIAVASAGLFFSQVYGEATASAVDKSSAAATTGAPLAPTREQSIVTRQMAMYMDTQHYLNMPLDASVSQRVLEMYLDNLDGDHALFLASDIDEFRKKYATTLGASMKKGDLTPAFAIQKRFTERLKDYYQYSLDQLDQPQNLKRTDSLNIDREKAPYFSSSKEQRAFWQQQLVSELISLTISQEEETAKQAALKADPKLAAGQDLSPPSELNPVDTLKKRFKRKLQQIDRIKSDRVLEGLLNAALATYDPHSLYFAPVEAMEMNRQTTLQLEGIGVSIRPERGNDDYTRVETLVDGGPASKSGLVKPGDRIVGVAQDGQPMVDVVGWPSSEIVGLIRGKRGTKVLLKLQAKDAAARTITLTRDVIQEEDSGVQDRVVNVQRDGKTYKMGVLDIPSFYLNYKARRDGKNYRSVSEDTQKALIDLNSKKVDGLVVDLRGDPGGSLEEVANMIGLFIKQGPVVQIRDRNGAITAYRDDDGGAELYKGPMIVLVNLASASASEIFAAAIQDYDRGLVVGSTTTGKGTAQVQLDNLAYGLATLTQRKFYRVSGGSTQNKGVVPDIPFVSIYDEDLGERKAKNPLKWDTIPTAPFIPEDNLKPLVPQLTVASKARQEADPQYVYLSKIKEISKAHKDQKVLSLDLDARRKEVDAIEVQTLAAENERRSKTGLVPYPNWQTYQISLDAQAEARAKISEGKRPPLPEEEAFVTESANILLDQVKAKQAK
ncbi:carboxy terminal-processing peptidase [Aquirhabdus sp.]|uniref:carboxy terminal-processing peptidase n=1 Tax=Aquirhabdus sp. TaxID=2824160 RepID=UPI00396C689E